MNINDFKFEPDCPQEFIDQAKKWLVDSKPDFGFTANFAVLYKTKKEKVGIAPFRRAGCHASIGSPGVADRVCVATENGATRSDNKSTKKFVDWLISDSFFSRFILNRDDPEFCHNYGFVVSADIPAPLLQNIMITTRHMRECTQKAFETFDKLSEKIPPLAAYHLVFGSSLSSSTQTKVDAIPVDAVWGHRAWGLMYSVESFRRLLAGEFGEQFEKDCDPSRHYRHYATLFGGAKYCLSDNDLARLRSGQLSAYLGETLITEIIKTDPKFRDRLSSERKKSISTLGIVNPFKKPTTASRVSDPLLLSEREFLEIFIPYLIEVDFFNNAKN